MNTLELYQQSKSPQLAQKLLEEHKETIEHHIKKWQGVLPDVVIRKHAENYAIEAFNTYDPSKGADIKTHLFNHLSKLARLNYENQNVVKIPEHQILQIRNYNDTHAHLTDVFGREPNTEEIADHMCLPTAHVQRLAKNLSRKDFTYDSDYEDIQQGDIQDNPESLYIQDNFRKLPKREQGMFQDLTGYNNATVLKPAQFGKKYRLKPYEVSRVKMSLAKKFK